MKTFTIFDQSVKKIIKTVTCADDAIGLQLEEGQGFIEGYQPYDTHKVSDDGTTLIEYSDTDREELLYQLRIRTLPFLDVSMTDMDLNAAIEEYYMGRIAAADWRVENYFYLRGLAYSNPKERADAETKISRGIKIGNAALVAEGEAQLEAINEYDWAVKERFPKN